MLFMKKAYEKARSNNEVKEESYLEKERGIQSEVKELKRDGISKNG